jgi:hypothetical protein
MPAMAHTLYQRGVDPNTAFGDGPLIFPIQFIAHSHITTIWGTCISLLIITWLAFGLRGWTRLVIRKYWGWDDIMMLITVVRV